MQRVKSLTMQFIFLLFSLLFWTGFAVENVCMRKEKLLPLDIAFKDKMTL